MVKFVFDVDGTLTPSRQLMDAEFQSWFIRFQENNVTYLVTGSDRLKTLEQVGSHVYNFAHRVYNCSGNSVWEQNKEIYCNDWKLPQEAEEWLREELEISKFPLRTGLHIEDRPGMVNFSVVGRNATLGERKLYAEWDNKSEERYTIAKAFMEKFPGILALVAGETGIDIFPEGMDKGQIIKDFEGDYVHFFGDKTEKGGNDYPLAKLITNGEVHSVQSWEDTWSLLRK